MSPEKATSLTAFTKHLHSVTAIEANRWEGTTGNKVWFQFRDTALTYPESYDARLSYVHRNAVHHGIVREPSLYPWCQPRASAVRRRGGSRTAPIKAQQVARSGGRQAVPLQLVGVGLALPIDA
jgi:putative transposase